MAEKVEQKPVQTKQSAAARKTVDKWKKKKWFAITASRLFDKRVLCETPAEKPKNVIGRTSRVTMDILTGQRAKRDYAITFKVNDVQGQTASTFISMFEINKGVLGRTIRRRNSKVALVSTIPVSGGEAKSTIVVVTERKATQKQEAVIREIIEKEYAALAGKEYEEVAKELLMGEIVNSLYKKASKICSIKKVIVSKSIFYETR